MLSRPFVFYMSAYVLTSLASSMLSVAVGWHIYKETGNPFDLALIGLMQILPIAALFIVAGWIVDNVPRKRVLLFCSALQAVVLFGLAFSLSGGEFNRLTVFSLLFLNGVARAFYGPAMHSTLPRIVSPQALSQAVAVSSTVGTTAGAAGPFVAGLIIAWIDTDIYWLLGSLTVCAALFFTTLPPMSVQRSVGRGVAQLLDGIRYVVTNPYVLPSISLDLLIVLLGSVVALLPVYAIDVLGMGPEALGLMRAMPAIGAAGAGILISRLPPLRHSGVSLFMSLTVFAVAIIVFALSNVFWVSLGALLIYGASDMVSVNVRLTIIQLATPDELRGRVNAVNSLFIASSNNLGDFRSGSVATFLGPVETVLTGGFMALAIAFGGYFVFPTLRRLDRMTDVEGEKVESNR